MVNNLVSNSATYTFTATKNYKLLCLTVLTNSVGYPTGHTLTVTAGSIKEIIKLNTAQISTGGSGAGAHANTFLLKDVKNGASISIIDAYGSSNRTTHTLVVTEIVE